MKLKPITFLPLEVGSLDFKGSNSVFFGSEAVYFIDLKNRTLEFKGFWRGANIWSVTSLGNKVLVGTKNGLIIFDDKAIAHWTGSRTIVLTGNFSKDVNIFALSFYKEKGKRYLRVYPLEKEYLEGESKRLYSDTIIPFFTPFGGPMDHELIRYLNFLTNVFDADGDGFDELILVNPGVDSAYLVTLALNHEKGKIIEINQEKLPAYTFRPVSARMGDLDRDGFSEIVILSNPKLKIYHVSMVDIVEGSVNTQSLEVINVQDVFEGTSDDGEAWLSVGDIDGDGFLEITFIWEEKPGWGDMKSRLFAFTKTFFGETRVVTKGLEVYPPLEIHTADYNNDKIDELISLSSLGIEIIDINRGKILDFLPIIGDIKRLIHMGANRFLVFGSVLEDEVWSYYQVNGTKIGIGFEIDAIKKALKCDKYAIFLDQSNKVWVVEGKEPKLLKEGVIDFACKGSKIFWLLENGKLNNYDIKEKKEEDTGIENIIKVTLDNKNLFILSEKNGKMSIEKLTNKSRKQIALIPKIENNIQDFVVLRSSKKEFLIVVSTDKSFLIFDEEGNLLFESEDIRLEHGNYFKVLRENSESLVFLYNKSLYLVEPENPDTVISLGYKGWQAITKSSKSDTELYVIYENGIYSASLDEVVSTEE